MTQLESPAFTLSALPYDINALAPSISGRTIEFHFGKHHLAYLNALTALVSDTEFAEMSLEDIIKQTAGDTDQTVLFNNAAQVWNHDFYWRSLSPKGGRAPKGELAKQIDQDFGSYKNLILAMSEAGKKQFGSGWIWLVEDEGSLHVTKTSNADNPISKKMGTPLLTIDVWEHAYYLDYKNRRKDYLESVLDHLINWNFAAENYRGKS